MRRVKVFKWEKVKDKNNYKKVYVQEALFHEWGCDCDNFGDGIGNFSTAIIEIEDGTIKNIDCELIQFKEAPDDK